MAIDNKIKRFELILTDVNDETAGVEAIAVVDRPAIEVNFMYFKKAKFSNDSDEELAGDVHPNCRCELINGEWVTQPGVCDFCLDAKDNFEAEQDKNENFNAETFFNTHKAKHGFIKQKFVKPKTGEKEKDFIPRCVSAVMNDGTTDDNKQAVAICYSYWKDKDKMSEEVIAPPYKSEVPKKKKIDDKVKKALHTLVKILGKSQEDFYAQTQKFNYKPITEDEEGWTFHVEYKYMKKLFSLDEVSEMHNILSAYMKKEENIFTFEGTTPWIQIKYMKSPEGKVKILSQTRIKNKNKDTYSFRFVNEDKRLIVSPLMIPDMDIPRIDPETDEPYLCFFSEQTIQSLSEKYMDDLNLKNSNIMHNPDEPTKMTLIESWVIQDPAMDKSSFYGFNLPKGTWMGIFRVKDNDTWNMIKSGELKGMSVEGNFGMVRK